MPVAGNRSVAPLWHGKGDTCRKQQYTWDCIREPFAQFDQLLMPMHADHLCMVWMSVYLGRACCSVSMMLSGLLTSLAERKGFAGVHSSSAACGCGMSPVQDELKTVALMATHHTLSLCKLSLCTCMRRMSSRPLHSWHTTCTPTHSNGPF